ncbi:hypothetical protein RDABS01_011659 [Bienertia sinuspersici]
MDFNLNFSLFFLLSLLFSSSFIHLSLSYEPRNPEVQALIDVKNQLIDPHGVLNNWDEYSADPCSWAMITCSSDNTVIGLGAPSQYLSGTLSGAIGNLTNLKQVLLQNNNISGKIPPKIGSLTKLQTLDLSNNGFSGDVPNTLVQLKSLQYLRLNNNTLNGAFPAFLANLSELTFLDLSFNNLSGPVPKFPTRTFNIVGNPLICGSKATDGCSSSIVPVPLSFSVGSSPGKRKSKKLAIALGVTFSVVFLFIVLLGIIYWRREKRRRRFMMKINDTQEIGQIRLGNLKTFTFKELHNATDGFSSKNILGSGGLGMCIGRLKDISGTSGELQFQTELELISLAVHRNLLRLIGFCATSNERLLVYPYMSNGSEKPPLDWNTRKRIAIGAARGLLYLHEQCDPKIIHRDVKAANVLMDDCYEAVVGDFGLAKLLDHAPEYLSTGQSSEKTDVFGFGILLLELITGMRALEFGRLLIKKVKKIQQEKKVEVLVDRELGTNYDRIEVGEMLQVALLCTQYLPAHRPKMSEVVRMLEGDGLAEKWAAAHGRDNLNMGGFTHPNNKSLSRAATMPIDPHQPSTHNHVRGKLR